MALAALLAASSADWARATWSVLIVDTQTREVAIGGATCLLSFDLRRGLPVVRVEQGVAAAQSLIDTTGENRLRIWNGLIAGEDPDDILAALSADPEFQRRQYGIVDTFGRAVTFTGSGAGQYAGGRVGQLGTMVWAIQGNVLTGEPVIAEAEEAVLTTPGGIPEKLMAAMEAARAMGGDGRCSCNPSAPTSCGSPPPSFTFSAYIGFMIVARRGDVDGTICSSTGCARGTYYLNFNMLLEPGQDPVPRLRAAFDAWRAGLVGRPDQVESRILLDRRRIAPGGTETAQVTIEVRDWRGQPATAVSSVEVLHEPRGSRGSSAIGPVESLGEGRYRTTLTPTALPGVDVIAVRVSDGGAPRFLTPSARLVVAAAGDANCDGAVNFDDIEAFVRALAGEQAYAAAHPSCDRITADTSGDGAVDFGDIDSFVQALAGG